MGHPPFAPYGEVYDIFGSTAQNQINFTGLTQDVFAGMYDTPNRELQGAQQGRWLSPDPAGAGWNQYAYATNPNSFTDPSGLKYCLYGSAPGCASANWVGSSDSPSGPYGGIRLDGRPSPGLAIQYVGSDNATVGADSK